jgi:hypothetical protein
MPNAAAVRAVAERVTERFQVMQYSSPRLVAKKQHLNTDFRGMKWEDQRALVQMVFNGQLDDGRRMGVYVTNGEGNQPWRYVLRGHLIDVAGFTGKQLDENDLGDAHLQSALQRRNPLVTGSSLYRPR